MEKYVSIRTMLVICSLTALAAFLAARFSFQTTQQQQQDSEQAGGLKTIGGNAVYDYNSDKVDYLIYQIQYPSNYYATSSDMLADYRSQGGLSCPTVLTRDTQLTMESGDLCENGTTCACIRIYPDHVLAISGVDDAPNGTGGLTFEKAEEYKGQKFTFQVRDIQWEDEAGKNSTAFDAYVKVSEDIVYYFQTCNRDNKQDLLTVLEHFDIRGTVE